MVDELRVGPIDGRHAPLSIAEACASDGVKALVRAVANAGG
jgi:hypothetical protein